MASVAKSVGVQGAETENGPHAMLLWAQRVSNGNCTLDAPYRTGRLQSQRPQPLELTAMCTNRTRQYSPSPLGALPRKPFAPLRLLLRASEAPTTEVPGYTF